MPAINKRELESLLYQAYASQIGIIVETNDFARARAQFYSVRRALADPSLDVLEFRPHPESTTKLIIVKKGPQSAEEEIDR